MAADEPPIRRRAATHPQPPQAMRHDAPRPTASRAARRRALERPLAAGADLPVGHGDLIDRSHERCRVLGLSRIGPPDLAPLGGGDMTAVRDRNQRLYAHAAPLMSMLFDQIAGTESMVVLTDATGTIIHSIGDDDFLSRASKVALCPGVNWAEASKGTNAIGTALVDERPTLVHADEHFMHANHFLTCSAAPILDPRGNILGVLDVTGDHRSYHPHTMALVKMSARMIENHWLTDDLKHALRVHFHARADHIGTLMEGILAVAPDGRVVGANRGALELLGLSGAALRLHTLSSLFGTTVGALVDRFRGPLATPLGVTDERRRPFMLHARFDWPVWTNVTEAAAAAATAAPVRGAPPPPWPAAAAAAPGPPAALADDPQVVALVDRIRRVLARRLPVLLHGETGSGKAGVARALHEGEGPFVVLHGADATVPEVDAAFDGIARAGGGTLFLRDVGEFALALQATLVRRLQGLPTDGSAARVIASARGDPRRLVQGGQLREDLFYALAGLAVAWPPLRERQDIAWLAQRLLDADPCAAVRPRLADETLRLLQRHRWPGNLRELSNVLRAAAALAGPDEPLILPRHLPPDLAAAPGGDRERPDGATAVSLQDLELRAIRDAVDACGGNISAAAKRLGISRNSVYRKLRWRRSDGG